VAVDVSQLTSIIAFLSSCLRTQSAEIISSLSRQHEDVQETCRNLPKLGPEERRESEIEIRWRSPDFLREHMRIGRPCGDEMFGAAAERAGGRGLRKKRPGSKQRA